MRPKTYKTSQKLINLQQPKNLTSKTRRQQDVFDRQEFRGLLHADFKDAVKGAFGKVTKKMTLNLNDKPLESLTDYNEGVKPSLRSNSTR